jgi:hypothetical protein
MHRSSNVLEALFAQIVKCEIEPTRSVLLNAGRNADPTGFGQAFEPSRDIHAITEDVAVLNNDIADVDAHAKLDAFLSGDPGITLGHGVLNLSRTAQGIDDAGEFDQQAVPGSFDNASSVFKDLRVDNARTDRP